MKTKLLPAFLVGIALNTSYAQSTAPRVVASAGDDGSSATHQLSWTIGEPIITTEVSANHVLTQGFHQTQLNLLSTPSRLQPSIVVEAFPNPTTQYITIDISGSSYEGSLRLQLLDITGKQLREVSFVSSNSTQYLNMQDYPSGVYLIHIQDEKQQPVSNFKVIKK